MMFTVRNLTTRASQPAGLQNSSHQRESSRRFDCAAQSAGFPKSSRQREIALEAPILSRPGTSTASAPGWFGGYLSRCRHHQGFRAIQSGAGMVGTFRGIGAALSTTAINVVAQNLGNTAGIMAIAAAALAAFAEQWAWMPETEQPYPEQRPPNGLWRARQHDV